MHVDFSLPVPVDGSTYNHYLAVYTNFDGNAVWWGYDPAAGQEYDYSNRDSVLDDLDNWDYGFGTYFEASTTDPSAF